MLDWGALVQFCLFRLGLVFVGAWVRFALICVDVFALLWVLTVCFGLVCLLSFGLLCVGLVWFGLIWDIMF